ncbi:hypothetical protein [Saccharopolyspora spinosa]|uniref:Uncharacterized protein n=1 Tax=Saccharopolyspora spinosa TaxID=60894 RepID=A0A2N3Y3Q4_SACSN|nr:hypothetical protein [Saccharopolyspora spinosa]PKW17565.1 hypothetical protein A8926_5543 [Saccharopolyspora spinosa]
MSALPDDAGPVSRVSGTGSSRTPFRWRWYVELLHSLEFLSSFALSLGVAAAAAAVSTLLGLGAGLAIVLGIGLLGSRSLAWCPAR